MGGREGEGGREGAYLEWGSTDEAPQALSGHGRSEGKARIERVGAA